MANIIGALAKVRDVNGQEWTVPVPIADWTSWLAYCDGQEVDVDTLAKERGPLAMTSFTVVTDDDVEAG